MKDHLPPPPRPENPYIRPPEADERKRDYAALAVAVSIIVLTLIFTGLTLRALAERIIE